MTLSRRKCSCPNPLAPVSSAWHSVSFLSHPRSCPKPRKYTDFRSKNERDLALVTNKKQRSRPRQLLLRAIGPWSQTDHSALYLLSGRTTHGATARGGRSPCSV